MQVDKNTATAMDREGQQLKLMGDEVSRSTGSDGKVVFALPVSLPIGSNLDSVDDPKSGVRLENGELTVPVRDAYGDVVMDVVAQLETTRGTGTTAELVVGTMILKTKEQTQDFTAVDPSVGIVGAKLEVDLKTWPEGASLKISINKEPGAAAHSSFQLAATQAGQTITSVAYVMDVTKTNLENAKDLGSAQITMKVSAAWVSAQGGPGNVRIIRLAETGEKQILGTTVIGVEVDTYTFSGISPDGLSLFGLAGVKTQLAATPTPTDRLMLVVVIGTLIVPFMAIIGITAVFWWMKVRGH